MSYVLIPVIIVLMAMVVVSLTRGIIAFLASTKADLDRDPADTSPSPLQLRQNAMMFARIKFQLAAIVVVVVLAAITHHS